MMNDDKKQRICLILCKNRMNKKKLIAVAAVICLLLSVITV